MKRLVVVAVLALAVLGAGGTALAYWQSSGTGTGSSTTGIVTAVNLSPATPTATLYPGGKADVSLTVANPNPTAVTITSLMLDTTYGTGGFAVDAAHSACQTSALSFAAQMNAGSGWSVPARTGSVNGALDITLHDALAMSSDAANACQGAQFTVYLAAGS